MYLRYHTRYAQYIEFAKFILSYVKYLNIMQIRLCEKYVLALFLLLLIQHVHMCSSK